MVRAGVGRLPEPRDRAALDAARALRDLARGTRRAVARPELAVRMRRAFKSGNPQRIGAVLAELHELRTLAEELAAPPWAPAGGRLSETSGVQSAQFMIDLLPHIQRLLAEHRRGRTFDVLDVGPGTGVGTALLASLYQEFRLGYRMRVSALDISPAYQHYIPAITPHVPFILEDAFDHAGRYDIVIASHVIEHIEDPVPFVRRLQELARLAVFVVAPFNEPADNLTQGHVRVIDEQVVKELDPVEWQAVRSVSWGAFADPPYEMLIARLAGKG